MARRSSDWQPVIRLEVDYRDDGEAVWVGSLARERSGATYFQYAASWLASGRELSPFGLPLGSTGQPARAPDPRRLHGVHGLFADSLPDQWGLSLQNRMFRRHGMLLGRVGALDRLAYLGERTMGALTYRPERGPRQEDDHTPSVDELVAMADSASGDIQEPVTRDVDALEALELAGGSPGGAQPKVLVTIAPDDTISTARPGALPTDARPCLLKFTPRRDEAGVRADQGAIEEGYARMARAAGLIVPPSRLLRTADGRAHFAVERFDRTPAGGRRHIHTLGGLLDREASDETDYRDFFRVARELTRRQADLETVWRHLCFNLFVLNDDDHSRNVAFLLDPVRGWSVAPAYDLTYAPGRGDQRGMTIAGHGLTATRRVARDCARAESLTAADVDRIYEEVRTAVADWPMIASEAGVSERAVHEIRQAMEQRRRDLEDA